MRGMVKFFNIKKGYGFIDREDKQGDIFFHATGVLESGYLEQNDKVEFEIGEGKNGKKKAVKIRRVK
ncbi:MAG: cold shock domain-containing protein [Candidatus Aminicenantes bacterium]|nr:MAG: cold shock domain-containing protein [Candidatus Aminicenantes bacterium]